MKLTERGKAGGLQAIESVIEFLSDPRRWLQGQALGHDPEVGETRCLYFAFYNRDHLVGADVATHAMRAVIKQPLATWNDAPGRTHKEVMEALKKARVLISEAQIVDGPVPMALVVMREPAG